MIQTSSHTFTTIPFTNIPGRASAATATPGGPTEPAVQRVGRRGSRGAGRRREWERKERFKNGPYKLKKRPANGIITMIQVQIKENKK